MASRPDKEVVTVTNDMVDRGFSAASYLESYISAIESAKAAARAQINAGYDNLVSSTAANKEQIVKQADKSFRDIYANAKVSAVNQNEQLAALGLSRGNAKAANSGYGETSRVRLDTAMQNNLSGAAMNRDSNLALVDSKIADINAQRAKDLNNAESQYTSMYLNALQQASQMEFDYYQWQQEFDYQQQLDDRSQKNWQAQFDYQRAQDAISQSNWQDQFDYQKEQDALSQSNWQKQFDYQKTQDAVSQRNWETEFAYQKRQDAIENARKAANASSSARSSAKSGGKNGSDAQEEKTQNAKTSKKTLSREESEALAQEQRYQRYLAFAQSAASFPTDEAYVAYFDQLYRERAITQEQYEDALTRRGFSPQSIARRLRR